MGRIRSKFVFFITLLLVAVIVGYIPARSAFRGFSGGKSTSRLVSSASTRPGASPARASVQLPFSFEANRGQFEQGTKFVARAGNYKAAFLADGIALAPLASLSHARVGSRRQDAKSNVIRFRFDRPNRDLAIEGADELQGKKNYFIGSWEQWHTNVPLYGRVKYESVYPGVDLVYYGNSGRLENDLVIAPGGNPDQISFSIEGNALPEVSAGGDLILRSKAGAAKTQVSADEAGTFILRKPNAYQLIDGKRRLIHVSYIINGNRVVFRTGPFDSSRTLTIDPVVEYSTYLGGDAGGDSGAEVLSSAVDATGNIYIAGINQDLDFPVMGTPPVSVNGGHGGFISKIDPTGTTILYSDVFLSAINGIAIDGSGDVFGVTNAGSGFSTTANALQPTATNTTSGNPLIFEVNPSGSALPYATYLGGTGTDSGNAIALDSTGDVYIAGQTSSANFPLESALQGALGGGIDGFVSKITIGPSSTTLDYSTYLGGSGNDFFTSVAVDSGGDIYVTGNTTSTNFPTPNQASTSPGAVVAKLNPAVAPSSQLIYSTALAGSSSDQGNSITADSAGDAYVAGQTSSCGFQVLNQLSNSSCSTVPDSFLVKFGPTGTLLASTFLGGSGAATSVVVASPGNVYVAGFSGSTSLPVMNAVEPNGPGAFVDEITGFGAAAPVLTFSTYLGSATYIAPGTGLTSTVPALVGVDGLGNIYVAGSTQTGLPIVNSGSPNVVQPTFAGGQRDQQRDPVLAAFITKISPNSGAAPGFAPDALSFPSQSQGIASSPEIVTVTNLGTAPLTITGITTSGDFQTPSNTCTTGSLAAGASCAISVTFSPTATGTRAGTLTVNDNGVSTTQTLALTGTGVVAAATLNNSSLAFANQPVGTPSNPQTLTLKNTGTAPLTITQISASTGFTQSNNCGTQLAISGSSSPSSCSINVVFDPTISGSATGTLSVADNAPGSPQTVSLSGTGTPSAAAVFSPASIAFGSQATGTASTGSNVQLTNAGDQVLAISSIATTGDFSETNSCGSSLAPGSFCTITVTFTPTATGTRTGALSVADNAPASPQSVPLSGTGIQAGSDFSFTAINSSPAVSTTTVPTTTVVTNNQPTQAILTPGGVASYTINVQGVNGFGGSVEFTCSDIPTLSTCTVAPNPQTISSSFPIPITATVTTQAGTVSTQTCTTSGLPPMPPILPPGGFSGMIGATALAAFGFILFGSIRGANDKKAALAGVGAVAFFLILCCSCGSSTTTTCTNTNATPVGAYTVTLTGTAGTAATNIQLNMTVCTKTQSTNSNNTITVSCAPVTTSALAPASALFARELNFSGEIQPFEFEPRAIDRLRGVR